MDICRPASNIALALLKFFCSRYDAYTVQKSDGDRKWHVAVKQPLIPEVVEAHLRGEVTVAAYTVDILNQTRFICFDLDEKLEDPLGLASKIIDVCVNQPSREEPRFYRRAVWLEASRYPDPSYHVWLLFTPKIPANAARWLAVKILQHAGVNPKEIEVFPKQSEVAPERPYGSCVKLPLGYHRKAKKWSRFLDLDSFEPLPSEAVLEAWGVHFSDADMAELARLADREAKGGVQVSLAALPKKAVKPSSHEEERIVNFLVKYWRRGQRNRVLMCFLGWAIKRGLPYDSALRIVREVCRLTHDEETPSRLKNVRYHYENRRSLGNRLLGKSGLKEIVQEAIEK